MKNIFSKITIFLIVVIAALVFWVLRENERRVAAESKYETAKGQLESIASQKDNAIDELETQVSLLGDKLGETDDQYKFLELETQRQTQELQTKIDERELKINELRAKAESDKSELGRITASLKEISAREEDWLAQKKGMIAANKRLEDQVEQLQKTLKKFETERAHLIEALKAGQPDEVPVAVEPETT